jgi:predicted small secreted protein
MLSSSGSKENKKKIAVKVQNAAESGQEPEKGSWLTYKAQTHPPNQR